MRKDKTDPLGALRLGGAETEFDKILLTKEHVLSRARGTC
jgi:hypothetical protein